MTEPQEDKKFDGLYVKIGSFEIGFGATVVVLVVGAVLRHIGWL